MNLYGQLFDNFISQIIAYLISCYQKYISPYKGYSCPHRILHGGDSCSQYVKRTVLSQDLLTALAQSKQRFKDCSLAGQQLRKLAMNSEECDCGACCGCDSETRECCGNCCTGLDSPEKVEACGDTCQYSSSAECWKSFFRDCLTCGTYERDIAAIIS